MPRESSMFNLAIVLFVAGLVVLLYGVSLNFGEYLNTPMVVGGIILGAAVTVHTAGIMAIDADGHAG